LSRFDRKVGPGLIVDGQALTPDGKPMQKQQAGWMFILTRLLLD
jgi:hypothetical protein